MPKKKLKMLYLEDTKGHLEFVMKTFLVKIAQIDKYINKQLDMNITPDWYEIIHILAFTDDESAHLEYIRKEILAKNGKKKI